MTLLLISPMTTRGCLLLHELAVERDDDHGELAVVGEELALDDVVGLQGADHRIEGRAVRRQLVRHQWRRISRWIRLAACRQHRHEAGNAVDELQLRRQIGEGFEPLALQEVLAFDDHEHVVLARRKAAVDRLVAMELLGVGAKQLRQRVIDLQLGNAHGAQHGGDDDEDRDNVGRAQRDEPQLLQAEREHKRPARLLSAPHSSPVGTRSGAAS